MSIVNIFTTVLYEPIYNTLFFVYNHIGNMGVAIILVTILIKIILIQPSIAQLRAQRSLQDMQPKLNALKEQYKGNKEGYNKAILQFYKDNKVNPLASCLPLLVQFPILIALYRVFINGVATQANGLIKEAQVHHLYGYLENVYATSPINTSFFGANLSHPHNIILAVLAGAVTFWQSKMLATKKPPKEAGAGAKDESQAAAMTQSMTYVMPGVTLLFAYQFPAGLALYWFISTLAQVGMQYYFLKRHVART